MARILTYVFRYLVAVIFMSTLFLPAASQIASAQSPDCAPGVDSPDCNVSQPAGDISSQSTAAFTKYYSKTFKGWYGAVGVGMRNTGYGTINFSSIPAGSTVMAAYLYWAIVGPSSMPNFNYSKGYFNGAAITGTKMASSQSPCQFDSLGNFAPIWTYRADVKTKIIKGINGDYHLTGFASGLTNGADPFLPATPKTFPYIEGASLVIFYSNNNMPNTTFQIYNGAATAGVQSLDVNVTELHLGIPGVNVVAPAGLLVTTFIGATNGNAPSTTSFFNQNIGSGWKGSDHNGFTSPYSHGNLWDTQNWDLTNLVMPPEKDLWFTSTLTGSCFTWVAQVVAYSSGNQDTDGDKLLDGWELHGYDANGDGIPEVNLPAMGANIWHKDLYVEADYMNDSSGYDFALPDKTGLDDLVNSFKNAPLVTNPDGYPGITLHIDTGGAANGVAPGTISQYNLGGGNQIPFQTNIGTAGKYCSNYNWSQFQTIKSNPANFDPARIPIFHYMIFAYNLAPGDFNVDGCGTVSGISRNSSTDSVFIKGATDFIVSLGGWSYHGLPKEREGTFMHELGHNLGLRHGGNDHVNYKPNYLSVMNYFFQTTGVYRNNAYYFDYSSFVLPSLNENALNEVKGLGPLASSYWTRYFCNGSGPYWVSAAGAINWNCDSDSTDTSVKVDINGDTKYTTLGSSNNWTSITFSGNGVIGSGASLGEISAQSSAVRVSPTVDELTFEMNQKIQAAAQSALPGGPK